MNRRTFISAASLGLGGRFGLTAAAEPVAPLVGVLEDSPRERLPRELVHLIRAGLRYEDLLAALSIAAARNVQPYPDVGFKYHVLMMLRSVDATTTHLPPAQRWLPIVWAAGHFKDAQAQERAVSGWRLPARVAAVESDARAARAALLAALDNWDRDAADVAVVNYSRVAEPDEVFAILFPYGARDLRAIGHKAIEVSNAHYLIARLGAGSHIEPILRSTVAALQNSDEDSEPAKHDFASDRPWRNSQELLRQIPRSWRHGQRDSVGMRADFRAALYRVPAEEAGAVVVDLLRRAASPEAIWRVLFDTAAELLLLRPGIVSLHAQTTANALYYAYRTASDESTQQMMLLQCAAFVAMFRHLVNAGARLNLSQLQALPLTRPASEAHEEIFADLAAGRRLQATRKCLGYLRGGGDSAGLVAATRHHLVYGADEAHDYKFTEALLENCNQLGGAGRTAQSAWRQRLLSAGMAYFKAPAKHPDAVVSETLELLGRDRRRPDP